MSTTKMNMYQYWEETAENQGNHFLLSFEKKFRKLKSPEIKYFSFPVPHVASGQKKRTTATNDWVLAAATVVQPQADQSQTPVVGSLINCAPAARAAPIQSPLVLSTWCPAAGGELPNDWLFSFAFTNTIHSLSFENSQCRHQMSYHLSWHCQSSCHVAAI